MDHKPIKSPLVSLTYRALEAGMGCSAQVRDMKVSAAPRPTWMKPKASLDPEPSGLQTVEVGEGYIPGPERGCCIRSCGVHAC